VAAFSNSILLSQVSLDALNQDELDWVLITWLNYTKTIMKPLRVWGLQAPLWRHCQR
jgi:hypothetical protein